MKRKARNQNGATVAEFAAAMVIGGPLLILLVFVGLECCKFYTIKSAMEVAARKAARTLVIAYNTSSNQTENKSVRVPQDVPSNEFIANSNQFQVTWDTTSPPSYVTVTCSYPTDGSNGLAPFPTGPLRFLTSRSTFSLKSVAVQGTFTLPIQ